MRHLYVHVSAEPAIVLSGLIAGFGMSDLWLLVAALLAAWFIDTRPWDPFEDKGKPDGASGYDHRRPKD